MPGKLNVEAGLQHQQAQARLRGLRRQAGELEARHGEYVQALKQVPAEGLYHVGDTCFIKLGVGIAKDVMESERKRLWKEVEETQREIVRLERAMLAIEIEAALSARLDSSGEVGE